MIIIKDKRGITLVGLVITIVVLLILASIAVTTGMKTIEYSRKTKFLAYMQVIQKKVDATKENGEYKTLGVSINTVPSEKIDDINTKIKNERLYSSNIYALPTEYRAVECLTSSGTQYINTGYRPKSTTRVIATFSYTSANPDQYNNGIIFGSSNQANGRPSYWFGVSTNDKLYYRNSDESSSVESVFIEPQIKYRVEVFNTTIIVNNESFTNDSMTLLTTTQERDAFLFARNNNGDVYCCLSGAIYGCSIYEGDEIIKEFVPCVRISDSVRGMYEVIGKQFYVNQGTGTFGIGEEIEYAEDIRYFDSEAIARDLEIEDIDDEIIVNFKTREVISLNGVKYKGKMYYSQYSLPGGQEIEQTTSTERDTELSSIEESINGLNATFTINDIGITNGSLLYSSNYDSTHPENAIWKLVTNYTIANETVTTDNITISGEYVFKLVDNSNSNNFSISSPISLKLTNPPELRGDLNILSDTYNYSDLSASDDWAFAQDQTTNYYYVWIPRFAYQTSTPTNIKFLKGTSELTTDESYVTESTWTIPDVFDEKTGVWVKVTSANQTGLNIRTILNSATIY